MSEAVRSGRVSIAVLASYALAGTAGLTGIILFRFGPRAALLPVAVVFGWFQMGGL